MSNTGSKVIWVVAALLLLLTIAFLLNKQLFLPSEKKPANVVLGEVVNKSFEIVVYYFPKKKSAAQALTYYFKEHGYNVSMKKAITLDGLKGSQLSPSHIFFNRSEIAKAMDIKSKIEGVVGRSVNAYRFHEEQSDPSLMMVFTEHTL